MPTLFRNLDKFKSKIALIGPDNNKYSYNQILDRIKYINSKIENRSLILIVASNNIQSIIGYITFIRSNNVSILLDKSFKVEYVKEIIKRYKPNYIFCPKGYIDKIDNKLFFVSGDGTIFYFKNDDILKALNKKARMTTWVLRELSFQG